MNQLQQLLVAAPLCALGLGALAWSTGAGAPSVDGIELQSHALLGPSADSSAQGPTLAGEKIEEAKREKSKGSSLERAKGELELHGRFLHGSTGRALSTGVVTTDDTDARTQVDADGRFSLRTCREPGPLTTIRFQARGFATMVGELRNHGKSASLTSVDLGGIQAVAAQRTVLRVVSEGGEPMGNVKVRLLAAGRSSRFAALNPLDRLEALSDDGGALAGLTELAPGAWRVSVEEPFERISSAMVHLSGEPGAEEVDVVVAMLDRSARISGVVRSDRGAPLPGATVFCVDSQLSATTDRDGVFQIPWTKGVDIVKPCSLWIAGPSDAGLEPLETAIAWGSPAADLTLARAADLAVSMESASPLEFGFELGLSWSVDDMDGKLHMASGDARGPGTFHLAGVPSQGRLHLAWRLRDELVSQEYSLADIRGESRHLRVPPPSFGASSELNSVASTPASEGRIAPEELKALRSLLGADLTLSLSLEKSEGSLQVARTTVNSDGTFAFQALDPGSFVMRLHGRARQQSGSSLDFILDLGAAQFGGAAISPVVAALPVLSWAPMAVRVEGRGPAALTLRLIEPSAGIIACTATVRPGSEGDYRFQKLLHGSYRPEAPSSAAAGKAQGVAAISSSRVEVPSSTILELDLGLQTVELRLKDALGEPVAHRSFGLVLAGGGWERTVRTDALGRVTVRSCPKGQLRISLLEWSSTPRPGDRQMLGGPKTVARPMGIIEGRPGDTAARVVRCAM